MWIQLVSVFNAHFFALYHFHTCLEAQGRDPAKCLTHVLQHSEVPLVSTAALRLFWTVVLDPSLQNVLASSWRWGWSVHTVCMLFCRVDNKKWLLTKKTHKIPTWRSCDDSQMPENTVHESTLILYRIPEIKQVAEMYFWYRVETLKMCIQQTKTTKKGFSSSCITPRISHLLLPCDSHSCDSLSLASFLTDCLLTAILGLSRG